MNIVSVLTMVVGVGSIIANIWIAIYNVGKNRTIYEIEEVVVSAPMRGTQEINKKLSRGEYTVLDIHEDTADICSKIYILGKTKAKAV